MRNIKKAPFFRDKISSSMIMLHVLIALLPVIVTATIKFGYTSLLMVIVGGASSVAFEFLYQKFTKRDVQIKDLSALVTGVLVGLTYPVTAPIWIVILGSFIAIVLVKQLPGGIGKNTFNPAVFQRVFIKIILTPLMTNWVTPLPDLQATATPLEFIGNGQTSIAAGAPSMSSLFYGQIGGGIGETVKWAIIIGYIYLIIVKIIDWKIPLATLSGLFLMGLLFSKSDYTYALYHVLSGTAIFAAVYMVTDYTSGPINPKGRIYYALAIGLITGIIRFAFGLPGGIGVAILILNMFAPSIDKVTTPRVFGFGERKHIVANKE